jgi:RNA polymerase sigma factor (sigma-70 family)
MSWKLKIQYHSDVRTTQEGVDNMSNEELVQLIQHGIDMASNMEQLYMQNKGLIYSIIKKYRYACQSDYNSAPIIEVDELMHEAYFGLVKAVECYDFNQGILFMSYAPHWIRQSLRRYLDNCGQMVRVPVHRQQQIYQYNQATSYFIQNYNREPDTYEYASWLGVTVKTIEDIEKYMFRGRIKSLDEPIPGGEDESITAADSIAAEINIEHDVIEKVGNEQLHNQLWELVGQVLNDDKKVQILKYRYIDNLTLEEIASKYKVTGPAIDEMIKRSLRLIKRNARIRQLAIEIGFWDADKPFSAELVKRWCESGRYSCLDKKELRYAIRMGWVDDEVLHG